MKTLSFICNLAFCLLMTWPVFSAGKIPLTKDFSWGQASCEGLQIGLYFQGQVARPGDQIPFWVGLKNNSQKAHEITLFYDLDKTERVHLRVENQERNVRKNFPGIRPHLPSKHGYTIQIQLKPDQTYVHPGHFFFLGQKFLGKNQAFIQFSAGDYSQCRLESPRLSLRIKA